MDFDLTPAQTLARTTIREFADKEIVPKARTIDENSEYPSDIIAKLGKLGFMGIMVPKEYGGGGFDTVTYAMAIEEISKACASTGALVSVHNSFCPYMIYKWGTEEQKRKYLPMLAGGDVYGAFAGTEPEAGSDLGSMRTTAELRGDVYVINGSKTFITGGPKAGVVIVFAATNKAQGPKGITAFIVESSFKGFKVGNTLKKMGINGSLTSELIFEDMEVPKGNILGKEGDGFKLALAAIDGGRIGIAAQAVGIAQAALEASVSYSKKRVQFGAPIANLQAIQWMLAEMATKVEASRLLTYRAALLKDQGGRFSKEAAMAKLLASESAVWCAHKAVQVHGGYGYMKDHNIERYYRDARITEIYEGTSEVQKLVIASSLLR
ncbi:MAG: acyl-CoA dehydrogenase [Candidatus Thermoplasmatota archaeon]|jgi:butyryl-CoA dehydrogenase|nr:acyl-CoA dehydrogenase [Candidatus Thermoplasmatota archaeon]